MSAQREYFRQCIDDCAADHGIPLTEEHKALLAEWVEGAHDNMDLAFYRPSSKSAQPSDLQLGKIRDALEMLERYGNSEARASYNLPAGQRSDDMRHNGEHSVRLAKEALTVLSVMRS